MNTELKPCPFCGVEKWLKEIALQLQVINRVATKDWDYYEHCLMNSKKALNTYLDRRREIENGRNSRCEKAGRKA